MRAILSLPFPPPFYLPSIFSSPFFYLHPIITLSSFSPPLLPSPHTLSPHSHFPFFVLLCISLYSYRLWTCLKPICLPNKANFSYFLHITLHIFSAPHHSLFLFIIFIFLFISSFSPAPSLPSSLAHSSLPRPIVDRCSKVYG